MTVRDYLSQLDAKLEELANTIISLFIQRDIDANLEMGFIKGRITFLDGSMLEFSEQLPTERQKYRFHYMDAASNLILRWDSAPHHRHLSTFPFHLHTLGGVQEHGAITLLEVFGQIEAMLEL